MEGISILIISLLISLVSCWVVMPIWIRKCKQTGLLWEDMNKAGHPKNVASSGGIVVVMAFLLGALSYVAIRTFLFRDLSSVNVEIFALMATILILAIVGLVDDLLGWHHGGLSVKVRLILTFFASVPLVVIHAGVSEVTLPILGSVNLGLFYPLILIPLGIMATTTVYNFLAGFNGLEAGQGILILTFLSYVAYMTGNSWLALIGLCMVFSLIAFWAYNKNPAKVFPGDILTYAIGAIIGVMAILGNFERIAFIVFIPYIIEMILKVSGRIALKGKFPHSFGIPNKDKSLEMPYGRIYGLTHFSIWFLKKIKNKVYENDVVYLIHAIQIIFILIAFSLL